MADVDYRIAAPAAGAESQELRSAYQETKEKLRDATKQADGKLKSTKPKTGGRNGCFVRSSEFRRPPRRLERARRSTGSPHPLSSIAFEGRPPFGCGPA